MGTVLVIIILTEPDPVEASYSMVPSSSRISEPRGGTGGRGT